MDNRNAKYQGDFSFTESLDTVIQPTLIAPTFIIPEEEEKRVARIFKLSALFSKRIILSDTQFVDNQGIRVLFLKDRGFRDFLNEIAIVGMRPSAPDFTELVKQQLNARMEFSSFDYRTKMLVKAGRIEGGIDELFELTAHLRFEDFIKMLNKEYLYKSSEKKCKVNFEPYPERVEKSLNNKKLVANLQDNDAKRLCKEIMDRAKEELKKSPDKKEIDRTTFYSAVKNSPYSDDTKNIVKRFFIDREYTKNFWDTNGFNCLTHPRNEDTLLFRKAFPKIAEGTDLSKKSDKVKRIELPPLTSEGLIYLDKVDFEFLSALRHDFKGTIEKDYLDPIQSPDDTKYARKSLQEYFNFLLPKIQKHYEDKGFKTIKKVNKVLAFLTGGSVGLTLADISFGIPYTTPEISFLIKFTPGAIGILTCVNILADTLQAKQALQYNEFEKSLREKTKI